MGIFDDIDRQFRQTKNLPVGCVRCGIAAGLAMQNIAPEGATENNVLLCAPCITFHQEVFAPRWFWGVGENLDVGDYENCLTREQALDEATTVAVDNGENESIKLLHSVPYVYDDEIFDGRADDIFEWWTDQNDTVTIEIETSVEQDVDLAVMLNAAFTAWRLKHRIGRCEGPDNENCPEVITPNVNEP